MTEETWEKLGVTRLGGPSSFQLQRAGAGRLALRPKRSKLERYIDILTVLNNLGPQRRTHILYEANLSWSDLSETLRTLEQAHTLRRLEFGRRVYFEITDEGKRFLEEYARSSSPVKVLESGGRSPMGSEQ